MPKGMTMEGKPDVEKLNWEMPRRHSCMLNVHGLCCRGECSVSCPGADPKSSNNQHSVEHR